MQMTSIGPHPVSFRGQKPFIRNPHFGYLDRKQRAALPFNTNQRSNALAMRGFELSVPIAELVEHGKFTEASEQMDALQRIIDEGSLGRLLKTNVRNLLQFKAPRVRSREQVFEVDAALVAIEQVGMLLNQNDSQALSALNLNAAIRQLEEKGGNPHLVRCLKKRLQAERMG